MNHTTHFNDCGCQSKKLKEENEELRELVHQAKPFMDYMAKKKGYGLDYIGNMIGEFWLEKAEKLLK